MERFRPFFASRSIVQIKNQRREHVNSPLAKLNFCMVLGLGKPCILRALDHARQSLGTSNCHGDNTTDGPYSQSVACPIVAMLWGVLGQGHNCSNQVKESIAELGFQIQTVFGEHLAN